MYEKTKMCSTNTNVFVYIQSLLQLLFESVVSDILDQDLPAAIPFNQDFSPRKIKRR